MSIKNYWLVKILDFCWVPLLYLKDWGKKYTFYSPSKNVRFKVRVNSSDKIAIREIWKSGVYNQFEIKPNYVIVDIGAHIGSFAIYAAFKAPKGRVFAYEASKENYDLLVTNKKLNHCDNLKTYHQAVTGKDGKICFTIRKNQALNSVFSFPNDKKKITVSSKSLASILKDNHLPKIDLLKIDVEGSEYDILLSSSQETMAKINALVIEYHELVGSKKRVADLKKFLEIQGFKVKIYGLSLQKLVFGTGYLNASKQ
jgi:FkbM family methyltransferase